MRPLRDNAKRSTSRQQFRTRIATYMASPAWAKRRRAWVLEYEAQHHHPPACAVCDAPWIDPETGGTLDVHHHAYEHLGHELFDDLVALCRDHHEAVHRAFDTDPYWRRMPRDAASRALITRLRDTTHHV